MWNNSVVLPDGFTSELLGIYWDLAVDPDVVPVKKKTISAKTCPLSPFVSSSFLAISSTLFLNGGTLSGDGGHQVHNAASYSSLGPESFTSATQPDFADAIPISAYVPGGVSIESRKVSVMFKDFVPPARCSVAATETLPTPAQFPSLACARTRTAHRGAAGACAEQSWSQSNPGGVEPRSRTRLPRLATTTMQHTWRSLSAYPKLLEHNPVFLCIWSMYPPIVFYFTFKFCRAHTNFILGPRPRQRGGSPEA